MSTLGAAVTQMRTLRPRERRDWPRGSWMGDLLPPSGSGLRPPGAWASQGLQSVGVGMCGSRADGSRQRWLCGRDWGWARGPAAGHLVNGLGQTEGEVAAEAWVVSG